MYKAGDWLDNVVAEALPQNEKYKDDFWATKVPRGFGSMLGFVGAGGAGKAMRMPMVAIHLNKVNDFIYTVHIIQSAYGQKQRRKNSTKLRDQWYMNQITAGRTRYINERRSLEWSNSIGLQLPKEGAKRDEHPAHALPIGLQLPKGRNRRGDNVSVHTEADLFKAN